MGRAWAALGALWRQQLAKIPPKKPSEAFRKPPNGSQEGPRSPGKEAKISGKELAEGFGSDNREKLKNDDRLE